jgi:2,5-diketo-D-gluconate reductase B
MDVLGDAPAAHQTEYHPLFQRPELVEHAQRHEYALVAYSPLAQGRVSEVDTVVRIAEHHDTTPAAVSIAWLLSKENVAVIPKASSRSHLRANLAAAGLNLTPEECDAIDNIDREVELFPE